MTSSAWSPPEARSSLAGWDLVWRRLERTGEGGEALDALVERVQAEARETLVRSALGEEPTIAAIRRLFKGAGTDPGRYRPSSEALLRRVLRGDDLPRIHPLVDLNNLLSIALRVPCCVLAEAAVTPPFRFRAGEPGERMLSLRGPFRLEGKPLLEDADGPFGTPITDSERVRIEAETRSALLVAYLPAAPGSNARVGAALAKLVEAAPVARVFGG